MLCLILTYNDSNNSSNGQPCKVKVYKVVFINNTNKESKSRCKFNNYNDTDGGYEIAFPSVVQMRLKYDYQVAVFRLYNTMILVTLNITQ